MKILDQRKDIEMVTKESILSRINCVTVSGRNGSMAETQKDVIRDQTVLMRVNGVARGKMSATPSDLPEMTAGWLRSHGLISGVDDIDELIIKDAYKNESENADKYAEENEYENADVLIDVSLTEKKSRARSEKLKMKIDIGEILDIIEECRSEGDLRKRTESVHSCRLIELGDSPESGYRIIHCSEDVGRHTAMNKAIGHGVMNRTELERCILLMSSRISRSMVRSAAACGIVGVLSIKYQTTAEAVMAARKNEIMLAGMNRDGELIIYERAGLI